MNQQGTVSWYLALFEAIKAVLNPAGLFDAVSGSVADLFGLFKPNAEDRSAKLLSLGYVLSIVCLALFLFGLSGSVSSQSHSPRHGHFGF